jgi:acyl-CoA thioesterase FadM
MRVRSSECDLQGAVFSAHYLPYADHGMTELWRAADD